MKKIQDEITEKATQLGGSKNKEMMKWYKDKFGGNHKNNKDLEFLKQALSEMNQFKAIAEEQKEDKSE